MYLDTQPLDKTKHRQLHLKTDPDYRYAAGLNFCPVFLQELPQVIREYFVCFPNNQTDLPHVLLGFVQDRNMYVAADGHWRGQYVPAYIRRYPFVLARRGDEGTDLKSVPDSDPNEYTLALDQQAPMLSEGEGEPLFTAEGVPSPLLNQRIELLKGVQAQQAATMAAVRQLEQAGLFKMEKMSVKHSGGEVATISGLRMVDPQALTASGLTPGPALELAYAHLFSRSNLNSGTLTGAGGPTPTPARQEPQQRPTMPKINLDEDDIIKFN